MTVFLITGIMHAHKILYKLMQGGIAPLHLAACHGRLEVVQLLIENYRVSPDVLTEV